MADYYEQQDLADFANIGEYAPTLGEKYFAYYGEAMQDGVLTAREKASSPWPWPLPRSAPTASTPIPTSACPWGSLRRR